MNSMSRDQYIRTVRVVDVIDGDTFRCDVDLGFYVTVRMSCRLIGINTPERNEPGGQAVREWLEAALVNRVVTVQSIKADKYAGRFDAVVTAGRINVNEALIASGMAVRWDGKGQRPPVPWPPKPVEE